MSQKTTAEKILAYLEKHPKMRVKDVAEHFNVHPSYIYAVRRKAGQEPKVSRPIINPEITMEPDETNVDQILGERGNRYGTFESNAKTCQLLKNVLHSQEGWYRLSYVQREAVEMMMHKISRLVNGDATYLDTVVDIAGYNQLMLEHMRDRNEGKKVE
jgi:predicted DNA-binding ArsR family transcriptional regulator